MELVMGYSWTWRLILGIDEVIRLGSVWEEELTGILRGDVTGYMPQGKKGWP